MFPYRFNGQHIAVILTVEADDLSHPQDHPTRKQILQCYPEMASPPAYCVPPSLIFAINACLTITLTKVTLSNITATLSSIKCNYSKLGEKNWASNTLL